MTMVLNTVDKSLEIELLEIVSTPLDYVSTWADHASGVFSESSSDGTIDSTSSVTITAAPAVSTNRVVKRVSIYNPNSTNVTILLKLVNGSDKRVIEKSAIAPVSSYIWTGEPAIAGPQGIPGEAGIQGEIGPGLLIYLQENYGSI